MRLKITKADNLYTAKAVELDGSVSWEASGPMDLNSLGELLHGRGWDTRYILESFAEADPSLLATASKFGQRLEHPERVIQIRRDGDQFRAKVVLPGDPEPPWETPHAMQPVELLRALLERGLDRTDITLAFRAFDFDLERAIQGKKPILWDPRRD